MLSKDAQSFWVYTVYCLEGGIYEIDYKKMLKDGHKFYISDNNVVLVECVPKRYLKQISIGGKT